MEYEDRNVFYIHSEPPELLSARQPKLTKHVNLNDLDYALV